MKLLNKASRPTHSARILRPKKTIIRLQRPIIPSFVDQKEKIAFLLTSFANVESSVDNIKNGSTLVSEANTFFERSEITSDTKTNEGIKQSKTIVDEPIQEKDTFETKEIKKKVYSDDGIFFFECPHCNGSVVVEKSQTACCIFRHGSYKSSGEQIPPHTSETVCTSLREKDMIYGCGKPFKFVYGKEGEYVEVCDYV